MDFTTFSMIWLAIGLFSAILLLDGSEYADDIGVIFLLSLIGPIATIIAIMKKLTALFDK